jgi:lipoprotein-releasing system ATP-binding protein
LLYILGLLDPPDAGRVSIESEPMLHLSDDELARKRNEFIGFIFQFHFLMEDFTAQENVIIPMRRLGRLSDAEMRDRAAGLLSAVGLGDKLRRPSRHLSGGEQQRVAIARALANDPHVIWRTNRPATSTPPFRARLRGLAKYSSGRRESVTSGHAQSSYC